MGQLSGFLAFCELMMSRILIKGGCLLSLDPKTGNHQEADVLIDGATIAEIGKDLRARDAEVIDARDTIVMPGFVDTHRHVWESLFRGVGDIQGVPVPAAMYGPHYSSEDVYAATLIGLLGAAEAGITTVVDWSDTQHDDGRTEAALQAHADSGLRTVFVHAAATWAQDDNGWRQKLRHLADDNTARLATFAAGPLEPTRGDLDRIAGDWYLARELGLRIHTHAGTDPSERGVVADLAARSLIATDVTLVHCSNLDEADLDAVASSGAGVSLAPSSEMAGLLGSPPIQQLIDLGIRPGLGVDNERMAPGDMFAQMRATISIQHATLFDLKLAGKAGVPKLLSTRDVIRYATVDGAIVAGLGTSTGSLRPGKQADIVVLRADRPNIVPINDPIGAVVWGMDTSNVDWVFVAGRALMRSGALEADVARARTLATTARERVAAAAGLLATSGAPE
jgi:cytosine/adenosine deaminase-related metal-dependent hydrolase